VNLNAIRPWCSAGVLALAVLAGCVAPPGNPPTQAPAAVPAPSVAVAQYWEYAVRDGYTGESRGRWRYTVAQADGERIVVDVSRDGEHVDTWIYNARWNGIEHPLTNLQRFRYDPPFPAFEFPLQSAKKWYRVVRATDPQTGRSYRVHVQGFARGWRRMRVPAGEFDALEVKRYVYAGNADFFTLQEEIVQTDWYSPAIGYVVLSEGTSSHIDTSRSGGGRGRPLRVRGDWLIAELVNYSANNSPKESQP
jgi:hypothetical protein